MEMLCQIKSSKKLKLIHFNNFKNNFSFKKEKVKEIKIINKELKNRVCKFKNKIKIIENNVKNLYKSNNKFKKEINNLRNKL